MTCKEPVVAESTSSAALNLPPTLRSKLKEFKIDYSGEADAQAFRDDAGFTWLPLINSSPADRSRRQIPAPTARLPVRRVRPIHQ